MSLPVYHHIHLKTDTSEEVLARLNMEMNIKNPVAIHVENFNLDQQREIIGFIENFFDSTNLSFKFPYPVFLISLVEASATRMPLVKAQDKLPRFFFQKEGRMNVKETHLALKNRLLHQEIKNVDPNMFKENIATYAETHRAIFELEKESSFYRDLLTKLKPGKKRG